MSDPHLLRHDLGGAAEGIIQGDLATDSGMGKTHGVGLCGRLQLGTEQHGQPLSCVADISF